MGASRPASTLIVPLNMLVNERRLYFFFMACAASAASGPWGVGVGGC